MSKTHKIKVNIPSMNIKIIMKRLFIENKNKIMFYLDISTNHNMCGFYCNIF